MTTTETASARDSLVRELRRGAGDHNAEYLLQRIERLIDARVVDARASVTVGMIRDPFALSLALKELCDRAGAFLISATNKNGELLTEALARSRGLLATGGGQ